MQFFTYFREFLFAALLKREARLESAALCEAFPRISIRGFIEASFGAAAEIIEWYFREFLFAALLKQN